jgi:hypothetical protein
MYRVNELKRKVLITPDEVIFHSDLDQVNVKNILSAIIISEERFVKKMICRDLYNDLRDKKNIVVDFSNLSDLQDKINLDNTGETIVLKEGDIVNAIDLLEEIDDTDPYIELWNEYLWKICAECVMYVSLPNRWIQSKAAGEMVNNPLSMTGGQEAASTDIKGVQWKSGKLLMDRIEPLIESMREWLCDNKTRFSKFNCYKCPECNDGVAFKRKTGFVLGIYDQHPRPKWLGNAAPGNPFPDGVEPCDE